MSILKYLKPLNLSSDQTWILKLMLLFGGYFWWWSKWEEGNLNLFLFKEKASPLTNKNIVEQSFPLISVIVSNVYVLNWIWMNKCYDKKKLYFYYFRTLLESTSRNHEKCCFDETARPLTSKRIYPGCSFGKNKIFHIRSVIAQKKYFCVYKKYIGKVHATSMELHIEELIVFVYALQDFILVKYQFYWSFLA